MAANGAVSIIVRLIGGGLIWAEKDGLAGRSPTRCNWSAALGYVFNRGSISGAAIVAKIAKGCCSHGCVSVGHNCRADDSGQNGLQILTCCFRCMVISTAMVLSCRGRNSVGAA